MLLIAVVAQSKFKYNLFNYNKDEVLWSNIQYFIFVEDFMCCVLVSKIPSRLYNFVQLSEQLRGKNQFTLEKPQKWDYLFK